MIRPSTKEEDDSKNDEANDRNDLDRREPKLGLAVPGDDENVQDHTY